MKGVTELSLNFRDKMGLFVRADGLYDFEVMDNQEGRPHPLNHEAKNLVGSYTRLLDAFGFWRFDLGSMPSELRLGRQVVSWGESTFIQGGLNQVNHFDVSALRVPGAELKEALLPDEMAVFNLQLSKNLSTPAAVPVRLARDAAGAGRLVLQHQRLRAAPAATACFSASERFRIWAWTSAPSAAR